MDLFEWAVVGFLALIVVGGCLSWLSYVSVLLGKMVAELRSLNEKFGGVLDWVKTLDEKADDHESRLLNLENKCHSKQ